MKQISCRVSDDVATAFESGRTAQGMSGVDYLSALILRASGRVSGLGEPVWPSVALDARVGNAVMLAMAAVDLRQADEAMTALRGAHRIIAEGIAAQREAIDTPTQQRMRILRRGDDDWGKTEHEYGTSSMPPRDIVHTLRQVVVVKG